MPRGRVSIRWFFFAMACAVVVAGLSVGGAWWSKRDHRKSLLEQSRAAYNRRDWAAAQAKAYEQLKTNRDDPEALRLLARALFRQGGDAAPIFERLKPDAMEAEDYLLLGLFFLRAQKAPLAIKPLQKALELDPNHVESLVALEQIHFRMDRLTEAQQEAGRLLAMPGKVAFGELMRGQICVQKSDAAGAVASLERALVHPEQWDFFADSNLFRKQLARALLQTGQPALARERLRQVTASNPDDETCWLLSRCDVQEGIPTDAAILAQARSFRESRPMEPEPSPFAGEGQCARCHAAVFRHQNSSRHARSFFRKELVPTMSIPQQPVPDPYNSQVSHRFHKHSDGVEVETGVAGQVYQTIIDYAFGSGDRGVTLVGRDQDGRSLEYRLSYYPNVGWDVTSGQTLQPKDDTALYQGRPISADDVRHCMVCHNTSPHAILTGIGPASRDRAIGCERCHGPGGNHVKLVSSKDFDPKGDADLAIQRPTLASGPDIVGLCAECHSPKRAGIRLVPGSDAAVRFQGVTLTWSRCYLESGKELDCLVCHDPHRDAETSPQYYESRCLQCHQPAGAATGKGPGKPSATPARGRTSCPVQPASGCIGCHMPKTETDMAHTPFTDHHIRVHRTSEVPSEAPP
jgi:tetratricopeptide (TPR) repeat protein